MILSKKLVFYNSISCLFNLTRRQSISASASFRRQTMASNSFQIFDKITKPREDKRDYRGLRLSNDLRVFLVSDPETDISAASLSVNIGSMADPWEIQGLAHFLEHMLFMGTKKYPSENEYSKFLSQHSGSCNAYTDLSVTNFFFDVAPEFLEPTLDRFAQFFIDPLMLESSVNRELEAVNSEYDKNVMNDSWRVNQIRKTLADSKHDYHKFNIGNYETLRDSPYVKQVNIRDELFKFYGQYYSANTMSLCVYGKENLDDLTKMVDSLFSKIVNKNLDPPYWPVHPYKPENLLQNVSVVPIKDKRALELMFKYPDERKHYKSSPGMYLAHLIGHESKGSLLSELKKRGLSSSLFCSNDSLDGFGFFQINVDLSEKALDKIDEIVVLAFQYINMLKLHGPKQYVFDELKGINYIKFHFMEKYNPMDYVVKLSTTSLYHPFEDVLSAYYLLDEFKPDLITDHLEYLKPENCNIMVVSKSFTGKTKLKEKYYGTDYNVSKVSEELISKLNHCGLNDNFQFPEPNKFIPTNFDILSSGEKNLNIPDLLEQSDHLKIWHLHDQVYLKPKVFIALKFVNPMVYANPFNVNANSMFAMLFRDSLVELIYDAELSGLHFTIRSSVYGFDLEFSGYNHKMKIFFQSILKRLVEFQVCPKRFEILKEKYGRDLRNHKTQPLYFLTSYYLKSLTSNQFWSYDDLIEALDRMDAESVQTLINTIFINLSIEGLFHGNITKDGVKEIVQIMREDILERFKSIPFRKFHQNQPREVVLEHGCSYAYKVVNDIQKPKAINIYFQISFDHLEETSKLLLIKQILSEPYFDYLRTKEQLGYIVYCKGREYSGVNGFNFVVQSDYDVSYLEDRIEAFIVWAQEHLRTLNQDEFEAEKKSLITSLLKKKKRMIEYSHDLWNDISKQEYHFTKYQDYAELVKKLDKEEISSFFNEHFPMESPKRRKVMIQIVKSDEEANRTLPPSAFTDDLLPAPEKKPSTLIEDVTEFTKYKSLHPIPKPKIALK